MQQQKSAVLVGLLVMAAIGTAVFFVSIAGRKGLESGESYVLGMTFNDASGLASRSRVVIAGIDIGKIERIELVEDKARVYVRISNRHALYEDASVMKRSESLLGDSLLDMSPGTKGKRRLGNGDDIANVVTASGMDQAMASMMRIAADVETVTGALAKTLGSDESQGSLANILRQANETSMQVNRTIAMSTEQLGRILANVERLTLQIQGLAEGQEHQVAAILADVKAITGEAKVAAQSISQLVNAQEGELGKTVEMLKGTLSRLDETVASAQTVMKDVENGEGVAGKLLRDKQLADQISKTANEATAFVDRLTGLRVEAGLRTEGHVQPQSNGASPVLAAKHTMTARIIPANSSRYYGFGVVSEPRGNVTRTVEQVSGSEKFTTITETHSDSFRLNAFLAQEAGPATFRIGLLESTGGVGVDLKALPGLSLSADAFDFTPVHGGRPRVRTMARYTFLDHFDIYAGGDDLLNGPLQSPDPRGLLTGAGRSYFVGGGFHFTDEDLKAILVTTGVPGF